MCGITGIIAKKEFSIKHELLQRLKRMEYRGYDSVGFATKEGIIEKDIGHIQPFVEKINESAKATIGIAHTRWSTHGGVTQTNAHPHTSCDGNIIIVHNGIIENFEDIKLSLQQKGHVFTTETDSEVIAHFFEETLKTENEKEACVDFIKTIKGQFAILILQKNTTKILALKRDSPLALGICSDKFILGSDIYAFSDETNKAIFFDDDEFAVISQENYEFYNNRGKKLSKQPTIFEWTKEEATKEQYPHYMIKEINEQPVTSARLINSFTTTQEQHLKKTIDLIKKAKKIVFVACGTSYHASLIGAILLTKMGYNARSNIASELENFVMFDRDTVAIAISQSGETMDVVSVLKHAKAQGAKIIAVVNVPFSTIQRMSDVALQILAGPEICVASTKAFTNQVIMMLEIARRLGYETHLSKIAHRIQETMSMNEEKTKQLAKQLYKKKDIFVLGKGISYPMAREIALKLKEIPYLHAEGMMAGELKHGTIALIEEGTPVISLIPNNNQDMISACKEVEARGAQVITIVNNKTATKFAEEFKVPQCCDAEFAIYAGIIGHLLSYYMGVLLNVSIDKPRNLAKSCTVK